MTSDSTGNTLAYNNLQFALGKKRVKLSELHPAELAAELNLLLLDVRLKELRGFAPVRDLLTRKGERPRNVSNVPHLQLHGFLVDDWLTLSTQAIVVHDGVLSQKLTYKRNETGEETTDFKLALSWGSGVYVSKREERIFVLTRPSNHAYATESFAVLDYESTKVPNENMHVVETIIATSITTASFCSFFGEKAPEIARQLIRAMRSIHLQTLNELLRQTENMRTRMVRWEHASNCIG